MRILVGDLGRGGRVAVLTGRAVLLAGLLVFAVHVATPLGTGAVAARVLDGWLYPLLVASGCLGILARVALVREDRLTWSLIAGGALAWAAGDVYWGLALAGRPEVPYPSIADGLYLAFYPLIYCGLVLLVRARVRRFHASQWLDGVAASLVTMAVGVAVLMPAIMAAHRGGSAAAVATNIVYPLADLLLLGLVVVLAGLTGWRPGRAVALLGAGCVSFAVADGLYLFSVAGGDYVEGGLLDLFWPLGLACMCLAAWQPTVRSRAGRLEGWWVMIVPGGVVLGAIALLVYDHYSPAAEAAVWLAAAALLVCMIRGGITFRENITQAVTDALTGLPNRRLFGDRVGQAVARARRRGERVAVMIIDLDRFKDVNDTLGHHAGDLMLQEVAGRLREALRASDTVARLGGDEFAVLLPSVPDAASAERVAISLGDAIAEPILVEGLSLDTEASIGIALFPDHGHEVAELLQRADIAMYAAKSGSLAFCLYGAEQDEHSLDRLALVGGLRRAIEQGELVLDYRPRASLVTGAIVGVEALVRWRHPDRGLLAPSEFIPVAERTMLIAPLTLHVIERALAQARVWENEGHTLSVAVGISARNLLDAGFAAAVGDSLARWGIAARRLELEIAETATTESQARALEMLRALGAMGVVLATDDLELARSLGLQVVAEGIDTPETADALRALGCTVGQRFHIGRPIPPEELSRSLDAASGGPTPSSSRTAG